MIGDKAMPIIFDNGKIDTRNCKDCIYYLQDKSCAKYGLLDDYCKEWIESQKSKQKPKRIIKKVLKHD